MNSDANSSARTFADVGQGLFALYQMRYTFRGTPTPMTGPFCGLEMTGYGEGDGVGDGMRPGESTRRV
jgi:hypothetical protein